VDEVFVEEGLSNRGFLEGIVEETEGGTPFRGQFRGIIIDCGQQFINHLLVVVAFEVELS